MYACVRACMLTSLLSSDAYNEYKSNLNIFKLDFKMLDRFLSFCRRRISICLWFFISIFRVFVTLNTKCLSYSQFTALWRRFWITMRHVYSVSFGRRKKLRYTVSFLTRNGECKKFSLSYRYSLISSKNANAEIAKTAFSTFSISSTVANSLYKRVAWSLAYACFPISFSFAKRLLDD